MYKHIAEAFVPVAHARCVAEQLCTKCCGYCLSVAIAGADKLTENAKAFFESLQAQKPTSLKGGYVKTITISTTMGPGVKVENFVN